MYLASPTMQSDHYAEGVFSLSLLTYEKIYSSYSFHVSHQLIKFCYLEFDASNFSFFSR